MTRSGESWAWFVPGRVEILGKHTDYAGGRSLLCAVEQGFRFVAKRRSDGEIHALDERSGSRAVVSLDGPQTGGQPAWAIYLEAVARRVARDFGVRRGMDLSFSSNLPPAAGVSSSSALTVGIFLALAQVNDLEQHPVYRSAIPDLVSLGGYLGAVENGKEFGSFTAAGGVGTLGGSQDQTAILCAEPDALVQYSFDPVRFERRIPFPSSQVLVIASSGVVAEKAGAARADYNAAAEAVHEIERRWRHSTGRKDRTLAAAVSSSAAARDTLLSLVQDEPILRARLEQFVGESETIIPAAGDALLSGDLTAFGALVDRSQRGAEAGLRNQIPETIQLQRGARELGAVAASAFGAGFGGSVWAMVSKEAAERFLSDWKSGYVKAFPEQQHAAEFFTTTAGPSAQRL